MTLNVRYLQLGKFFPPNWGGIETVTHNLLIGLNSKNIENTAIVFDNFNTDDDFNCTTVVGNNTNVLRYRYFNLFGKPFSFGYIFSGLSFSEKYDIVLVHLPNPVAIFSILLSRYKGKIILYWHSDIINKGFLGYILLPLERWLINRANLILAPTTAHLRFSRHSDLIMSKGKVIPYPIHRKLVDIAESRKKTKRILCNNKTIKLIAIGRLVEYKGFEFLIRSLPLLKSQVKIHLNILGDGPLLNHLRSVVIDLNLIHIVSFCGSVSDAKRDEFLSDSDIFCFPSINKAEMYGMVQLEAMANGLPIIATNIFESGSPELTRLSGAGVIVEPYSSTFIAEAIDKLIADDAFYSQCSLAGLNAITNLFNPEYLLDEFISSCENDMYSRI